MELLFGNHTNREVQYYELEECLSGEKNLEALLISLSPELLEGAFVFCTLKGATYGDHVAVSPIASSIASFTEAEGLTLVVNKKVADRLGYDYSGVFKCIRLQVHSSLAAVGLTATVIRKLSQHGISANVMAVYFHDHVFIPVMCAQQALELLVELSGQSCGKQQVSQKILSSDWQSVV